MNFILRKIGFLINKNNCYVYGIDSHVTTNDIPTLIFKNGDEYHFKGRGIGCNFSYVKNSITPVCESKIKTIMSQGQLEKELFLALKRDGFHEVFTNE